MIQSQHRKQKKAKARLHSNAQKGIAVSLIGLISGPEIVFSVWNMKVNFELECNPQGTTMRLKTDLTNAEGNTEQYGLQEDTAYVYSNMHVLGD